MAIPPFPSQDLAKLVLGYLAEEQLMTAYDEFLLASPYLDALRNEYDRIFMTSLKNILAEYRAVKIYVETCKPFLLRKKLLQCSNLLEIVKYLISYIDTNRLCAQETNTDKISSNKQIAKSSVCNVCNLMNLDSCMCKSKSLKSVSTIHPASQIEASTLESSIETTSLSDLPGNSVTEQIVNNNLVIETGSSETSSTEKVNDTNVKNWNILSSTSNEPQLLSVPPQDNATLNYNTQDITSKSDESKQKIEEFNNILNLVCSNNNSSLPSKDSNSSSQDCIAKTIYNAGSFQEFASGVSESRDKERAIVPDSSTSEIFSSQNTRIENKININQITNIKSTPKAQFLLKVGTTNIQNIQASSSKEPSNTPKNDLIKIVPKQKHEEQKVKILSDVKVDKSFKDNIKVPPLKPITSNPLFKMQTIVINGTPAYKHKSQSGKNFSYTKDEIMAMPTIILVPASGASQNSKAPPSQSLTAKCLNIATKTTASTARMLGPLLIDVASNNSAPVHSSETLDETISQDVPKVASEVSLAQPIDITHSSVPKDTNLTVSNKTSTPNVLPPTRKSSSTPRRTSHVRVLDFATPRRILHETIDEQDPNKDIAQNIEINKNIDFSVQDTNVNKDNVTTIQVADSNTPTLLTNESGIKMKKNNWDAQLRALAVRNNDALEFTPKPKESKKSKVVKKKVSPKDKNVQKTSESEKYTNKNNKKKLSPKTKRSKKKDKTVGIVEECIEEKEPEDKKTTEYTFKPTANVIKESDWNTMESKENTNNQIDLGKMNYSDERVETPETERLSLQNVIGAKLNISDLLETPYKQVLYDIQMETPKFLGPDLPDEPISDIKIMNIPTPRFLTTPKPIQATPSSYSSRPTDYSSGGSYYKPDDQDFIPAPEVLEGAITVIKEPLKDIKEAPKVPKVDIKDKSHKSTRPQRKCTKNVSYRSPNVTTRNKDTENQDIVSVSSETSNTSSREKKIDKSIEVRNKSMKKKKVDCKKKVISTHKSKKETPKKYSRIQSLKKTPIKETSNKGKKKNSDLLLTLSSKSLSRKRTSSKEKSTNTVAALSAVPTKSRRKSSTPRKLHCTKSFTSDSTDQNSSDLSKNAHNITGNSNAYCIQESDSDQQPLRWSDDGSQDAKSKETEETSINDDISKIKEYIETSVFEKIDSTNNTEGSLHIDLVKRGFDVETAKIIERDLLDANPIQDTAIQSTCDISNLNRSDFYKIASDKVDLDGSLSNNLQIVQDEFEYEDLELSAYECDEESKNFVTSKFDESKFVPKTDITKLKDKFSMEVCIEDGVSIRLRATRFQNLFEDNVVELNKDYNPNETEAAVKSICNIDKLYTPMKDLRAQCYEIFDSTLTSIDTPLKTESRKESIYETTVTEIVLEVENIEAKDKSDTKKRKRVQSGISDESIMKKTKPDTQYLLNSANIQNIDIESVLSKLHGP